jgi:hypothetical protein
VIKQKPQFIVRERGGIWVCSLFARAVKGFSTYSPQEAIDRASAIARGAAFLSR